MLTSPGMSLMVAGVASGICFLIYTSVLKGKSGDSKEEDNEIPVGENRCACCLRPLYLGRGVRCKDCGEKSCRKGCSRFDPSDNAWRCIFCRQQRNWLERHGLEAFGGSISQEDLRLYFNTAKSRIYVAGVENAATSSGQDLAAEKEEANTMETFRDFVEKIVVGLIGNMDVPINRVVYHHSPYGKLLEKHLVPLIDALASLAIVLQSTLENKSGTDVGTTAQALRDIVERVVEEAKRLPGLGSCDGSGRIQEERNGVENSYEEVLATTILNKVIEKYQKKEVDGNSNVLPGKIVPAKYASSESEAGLDEGVEEGCSSLEPLSQEDCASNYSASSSRRVRNQPESLSLTIEERIEEVTTTYASDEDSRESLLPVKNAHRVPFPELGMDIIDPFQSEDSQDEIDTPTNVDLVFPVESWEENWLFQKRKVQTQQADSVAMLVPNPSADYKALIGDKDAEDTSDLSECSSAQADEDIEKELMEAISNVVPRTPDEKKFGENDVLGQYPIVDSSKIDIRGLKDRRIDEDGERRGDEVEAKEVEVEYRSKSVNEKPVPKAGNLIDNENGSKDETRNLINEESSVELDCSMEGNELFADNLSNRSKPFAISTTDENLLDLPKTPTSTPRISMVELRELEGNDNLESIDSREKNVLNSLECAKKKLMAVNDVEEEVLDEEEAMFAQQKVDFHAEDIQEQESEYTEHYDIATQRHLDSLTKSESSDFSPPIDSTMENEESKCREAVASAKAESASHQSQQSKNSDEEVRLATPPRPGTIAEREHKKWENAPPIENNPYSRENIQKRLWERQYSRRSSENSGIYTELSTSNGTDLLDVLTSRESNMQRIHNELAMSNGTDTDDMSSLRELNIQRNLGDYYDTKVNEKGRRSSDNPGNYELSTSSGSLNDVLTTFRDESVQRSAGDYYVYDQKASVNEKGRRSSDNPGSVEDYYEKNPKSSANKKERRSSDIIIDDVSIFQELNIQRSAGDCYTNDSKPSVNNKGRRSSGFSTSTSRPSSSLSQRSSFNGIADQDQQVSFQLEKFEEASLRGSLSRWTYRDPYSSSNFAVNPLLRMELDASAESADRVHENVKNRNEISLGNDDRDVKREKVMEGEMSEREIMDREDINEILQEIEDIRNGSVGKVNYDPLHDLEGNNNLKSDRDSGMSSVDTNDLKVNRRKQDQDCWRRLWIDDFQYVKNEQIVSLNGRRYFNSNGYKYNTFGGIKKDLSIDDLDCDSDEDNSKPDRSDEFFDPGEFSGLKFQTFGGIKGSKKVDRRGILMYRRVTLRSSIRNGKNLKGMRTSQSDSLLQEKDRITEDTLSNEDRRTDYQSDNSEEKDASEKYLDKKPRRKCNKFCKRQPRIVYSSSSSTDDDWQDEEVELPNKTMMQKFLKDASKKMKSNSDNDPNYFLNTSRKKIFNNSVRRSPKHRSSDDNESLKLEPPIVPEVIEKSFESLQDLRGKGKGKKKHKASESIKYVGVRSLSDLTIW
ncbi:uncharacterized protein LOC122714646 isoform X3 [Apis laboriosa]|uniref:uncharacterized protein LOC122714646 isoform X3 n=1 Tax=Apis laboriosa TaxID=183418 RepID=UPI001CC34DAA|nr:uncharacterized protein LOC122714646 isoform X3 [Apis laboriosa]